MSGAGLASEKKARIAVVTTVHPWNDPRVFEREVFTYLEWGHEVHVFLRRKEEPVREGWANNPRLHFHLLSAREGRSSRLWTSAWAWLKILAARPFDLVHFHDPELIPAMGLLSLVLTESYFLYDVHEELPVEILSKLYLPGSMKPLLRALALLTWKACGTIFDGFAPATEQIGSYFPPAATKVVHNYPKQVYFTPLTNQVRRDLGKIVYVGGIAQARGIIELLKGVALCRQTRPALHLHLIGPIQDDVVGPHIADAIEEGWCTHIAWLKPEALADYSRDAAIGTCVLLPIPNYLEALPTKMFEYMSLGVPVLASDFPLWRRIVTGSGAGVVVEPSFQGIARGIEQMLSEPSRLESYGAAGRLAYLQNYRWEAETSNLDWHVARALAPKEPL